MTPLDALLLGIVQGITEFLPISSSGHLMLIQNMLGLASTEKLLLFDLVCHMGTLLAIFFIFFQEMKKTFFNGSKLKQVILATLPLFPLVIILKPIKALFGQIDLLGYFFLANSCILTAGVLFSSTRYKERAIDPLLIGCAQALAILPGISRSGSTISAARLVGWSKEEAVVFSFLIGSVAILGGFCLEMLHLSKADEPFLQADILIIAFLTSLISGFFALHVLIRFATKRNLLPFAIWTALLGIYTLVRYG